MTRLLFLAGTFNEHPIEDLEPFPLWTDDLKAVSATFVQPGESREEFLKNKVFVLDNPEAWEDLSFALVQFVFKNPSDLCIFGFDIEQLIRRISFSLAKRGLATIPAILWSGSTSRAFNIVKYLGANSAIEPVDLVRGVGLNCLPIYKPHRDHKEDQVYLLELALKFNMISERINIAELVGSLKLTQPAQQQEALKPAKKETAKTSRTLKNIT